MRRRAYRANHFARRILTLLAHYRLEESVGIVNLALIVAVDADPMHLASTDHLILADHGNVVLRLAGDYASITADAGTEIDGESPAVAVMFVFGIKRQCPRRVLAHLIHALVILGELLGGAD